MIFSGSDLVGFDRYILQRIHTCLMDHTFLPLFQLQRTIFNSHNSIDSIVAAIKDSVGDIDLQFRHILFYGIKSRHENAINTAISNNPAQSVDFNHESISTINKINKTFQENGLSPPTDPNPTTNVAINHKIKNVFRIQTLLCNIFQFLDFESLIKASLVNNR